MKKLGSRGDTIVEVLISIAVVGALLVISYATTNRSMLTIRANQERSEAARIAQAQIEAIGQFARDQNEELADIPDDGTGGFCIIGADVHGIVAPVANIDADDLGTDGPYAEHCNQGGLYNFAAIKLDEHTYRVRVRWERIGGGPRNELTMSYRVSR